MIYPSSIPDYNQHRLDLDAASLTGDAAFVAFIVDEYLRPYVVGQFALMMDVNGISGSDANREAIVDAANKALIMYDFCALVADCIDNNTDVRDAIEQIVSEQTGNQNPETSGNAQNGVALMGDLPCSDSVLSGAIRAIIDYVVGTARDIVEIITDQANELDAIVSIIAAIPGLGELPLVNDLPNFVQHITAEGLTSFEAGITTSGNDEVFCAIYDEVCTDCDLTVDEVINAFISQAGLSLTPSSFVTLFVRATTDSISNTMFAYGLCAFVAAALGSGGKVLGLVGARAMKSIANSSTPNNDYINCDPCVQRWCYAVEFGVNFDGIGEYTIVQGALVSDGVNGVIIGANTFTQAWVAPTLGNDTFTLDEVELVSFHQNGSAGYPSQHWNVYLEVRDISNNIIWSYDQSTGIAGLTTTMAAPLATGIDTMRISVRTPASGQSLIKKLTLRGRGVNPFTIDNC